MDESVIFIKFCLDAVLEVFGGKLLVWGFFCSLFSMVWFSTGSLYI